MSNKKLEAYFDSFKISYNDQIIKNLCDLCDKTLETNEKFNLTAITNKDVFYEKMILDSALGIIRFDLTAKKVIDVGTGAGFPGLVLYILNNDIDLTLLDSTSKKINYLREYCEERNYNVKTVASRAEDFASKHREEYDFAYARAVSSLSVLLELIMPMLKVGGYFIALKGKDADNEIKEASNALKLLNAEIVEIQNYVLPDSKEERNILVIRKNKETMKKYPRQYNEIKRRPL